MIILFIFILLIIFVYTNPWIDKYTDYRNEKHLVFWYTNYKGERKFINIVGSQH